MNKKQKKKRSKPFFEALAMLQSFISIEVLEEGEKILNQKDEQMITEKAGPL